MDPEKMEWPTNKVIAFIEEVKSLPILWDSSHPFYKINRKKMDAWQKLATKFSTNIEESRKKWSSLQASLRREKSKEILHSGMGIKEKSKWFAYEALKFMGDRYKPKDLRDSNQPYMESLSAKQNQNDKKTKKVALEAHQSEENSNAEDDMQVFNQLTSCVSNETHPQQCRTTIKRKCTETTDTQENSFEKKFLEILDHHKSCPVQMNTDRAFFESLMPSLENFSEDQKIQFKIEVLQLIQKIKSNQTNKSRNYPVQIISGNDTHFSSISSPSYEYENSQSSTPSNLNEQSNLSTSQSQFTSILIKSE